MRICVLHRMRFPLEPAIPRATTAGRVRLASRAGKAARRFASTIAPGMVSSNATIGTRDPGMTPRLADDLDVTRDNAHQHLSFGGGAHYCLGAALARVEGQVAIGTLAQRFPKVEQAGDLQWNGRINLRGLETLPLTLNG